MNAFRRKGYGDGEDTWGVFFEKLPREERAGAVEEYLLGLREALLDASLDASSEEGEDA